MKAKNFVVALLLGLAVCSCQKQETRLIHDMDKLSDQIEYRSDSFTDEDWDDVLDHYEDLHERALKLDFSQEQLKELGRAEGRLTTLLVQKGAKAIGSNIRSILKGEKSFLQGLKEGLGESADELKKELEEGLNELGEGLDELGEFDF